MKLTNQDIPKVRDLTALASPLLLFLFDAQAEDRPSETPGTHLQQHHSTYIAQAADLKRQGKLAEAESLLLSIITTSEQEAIETNCGVAPWAYEQLAIIYARRKERTQEIAILERFARQPHAPGVKPARLLARLAQLIDKTK